MAIDLAVGVAILLFAAYSYYRGLLRKLAGIAALVIASLASGLLGRAAATCAARRWDVSPPLTYIVCCVLAWVVLYFVGLLLLGHIAKRLGSDPEGSPKPWNRKLGALFGVLEAGVLCWFLVGILDAVPEDIRLNRLPRLHEQMKASFFAQLTHATNPAALLELQPLIADVSAIAEKPQVLRNLPYEPAVKDLMDNEKVKRVLADERLLEEWRRGRIASFLNAPSVRDALEDPQVRGILRRAPLREVLHRAAENARQSQGFIPAPSPAGKAPGHKAKPRKAPR